MPPVLHPGKNAPALSLPRWVSEDPVAAEQWIRSAGPSADLDDGRVAIATSAELLAKSPDIAAGWAESIHDPELRATVLQAVVDQWIHVDPVAARAFVQAEAALRPEERAVLLKQINSPPAG
jgi:hypothetical protein